jgi:hypothetical protein
VFGRPVLVHRLAFFWMYGVWPKDEIDHVNGTKDDNRLINIRPATRSQNERNKGPTRRNTSSHKGVFWSNRDQRWVAKIAVDGRQISIPGKFRTAVEASRAYQRYATQFHGQYARWEKSRPSKIVTPEPAPLVAGEPLPGVPLPDTFKQRDWIIL